MKKHYVAEITRYNAVKGSIIVSVWPWQSCRTAYGKINAMARPGNYGILNFRRVR